MKYALPAIILALSLTFIAVNTDAAESVWYEPQPARSGYEAGCAISHNSPAKLYELFKPDAQIVDRGDRVDVQYKSFGYDQTAHFFRTVESCMRAVAATTEFERNQKEQENRYLSKYR